MAEEAKARYLTYSWLRQGLLAGLGNGQALQLKRDHLNLPLSVSVNGRSASMAMDLYGPGDVTGIDRSEIIRIEPAAGSGGFEPNLFPLIEFDRPDFPWLFTPATATENESLPPWLCLVTIPQSLARLALGGDRVLPSLRCPRGELPNLDEAWAWAHTQILPAGTTSPGPSAGELSAIIGGQPERTLARLVCPRRLQPQTGYLACLVPVYECGRRAGLGLPPVADSADPLTHAWQFDPAAEDEVQLPVYYHWYFSTGLKGDFELLASRLKPKDAPSTLGVQTLDVSRPGWGMPVNDAQPQLDFHGPLLADDGDAEGVGPDQATSDALRQLLNQNAGAGTGEIQWLTPPLYGQNYAGLAAVPAPPSQDQPNWFAELNLDPRYRAAAGLGADVIRREQESLMVEAWEQLASHYRRAGAPQRAGFGMAGVSDQGNQVSPSSTPLDRLQRAQLADQVGQRLKVRHLNTTGAVRLLQVTGARPGGQAILPPQSLDRVLEDSQSAAYRRLTRGGGPLASRLRRLGREPSVSLPRMAMPTSTSTPGVTLQLRAQFQSIEAQSRLLQTTVEPRRLVVAALQREQMLAEALNGAGFAPRFDRPMYETLRAAHRDLFLPGYQAVANESVTLLKTNPRFVEAYMAGLNHEMGRELLWRGYPAAADATFFTRFWDRTGCAGATGDDIQPIAQWALNTRLGTHGTQLAGEPLVLLVRGELMKRYPRALIYAVKAVWDPVKQVRKPTGPELWPSFRASLDVDQLLFGFDLQATQVGGGVAGPDEFGWFFIIQEQPTEPRFGLDEAGTGPATPFTAAAASWRNLSWSHIDAEPPGDKPRPYLWLKTTFKQLVLEKAQWGKSSADMAYITRQKPFRVAIHGSVWVSPKS